MNKDSRPFSRPPSLRPAGLLLVWLMLPLLQSVCYADGPGAEESNPALLYYQTFLLAAHMSPAERTELRSSPLSPESRRIVEDFDWALVYASRASGLQPRLCDWGIDREPWPYIDVHGPFARNIVELLAARGQQRFDDNEPGLAIEDVIACYALLECLAAEPAQRGLLSYVLATEYRLARVLGSDIVHADPAAIEQVKARLAEMTQLQALVDAAKEERMLHIQWVRRFAEEWEPNEHWQTELLERVRLLHPEDPEPAAQILGEALTVKALTDEQIAATAEQWDHLIESMEEPWPVFADRLEAQQGDWDAITSAIIPAYSLLAARGLYEGAAGSRRVLLTAIAVTERVRADQQWADVVPEGVIATATEQGIEVKARMDETNEFMVLLRLSTLNE